MKNNEILVSVKIQNDNKERTLSFLVIKDITLKSFVQGIYYGLRKMAKKSEEKQMPKMLTIQECFSAFEKYIKTHNEILVFYTIMGQYAKLNINEKSVDELDEKKVEKKNYDMPLSSLGIVTASQIFITDKKEVEKVSNLFDEKEKNKTYILRDNKTLEYNISTRRLNVIEPTVIDILPAGDMPAEQKGSVLDTIAPAIITGVGMIGIRFLISIFTDNAAFNSSMMAMTIAMPFMSAVNSVYSRIRQSKQHKESVADWKEKYEKYINNTIIKDKIVKWQTDEIAYLNKVYPKMDKLFNEVGEISTVIFARSQNDNDFMRISLGESDEIKPSFEIKAEQKDDIFYDVEYKLHTQKGDQPPYIEIIIPQKKNNIKKFRNSTLKNQFLLTELPYIFSTTQYDSDEDKKEQKEQTGFKYLRDTSNKVGKPPLLIDLKNIGTLGVISKDNNISINFIRHLVFELSFYHSPEDLQMVFFFNKEKDISKQNEIVKDYLFLPHTNELFDNLSQFVFDEKSAGEVFSQLQTIITERAKSSNTEENNDSSTLEKYTQVVCFVMNDYDVKEKAFSKYIPEVPVEGEKYVNSLGLTFIFIQPEKGMLPKYCGSIVELDENKRISNRYNLLSHETLSKLRDMSSTTTDDIIEYTHFTNSYIFPDKTKKLPVDNFSLAFKRLSSIYYTRIAENGKVPSLVTLFELYKDIYNMDSVSIQEDGLTDVIRKNWTELKENDPTTPKNDVTKDLKVVMGKNEHGITCLDLHENADGPHMLVAGTTGSGKSETIITYLIGLCVKYSPTDLNLMLVDMKGGGFSERLGNLPHCVGTVTNTAGENQGISAVYMLKRFLESLNAEVKNRQIILADLEVDNADSYIRVLRKIKKIHELKSKTDTKSIKDREELITEIKDGKKKKQIQYIDGNISKLKTLSHLILVVDEFTELKRFSSESDDVDFIAEITTIARIGRTLGLHIILVSQNIEGAINDDIRVNTKSKICLKVATKQASKEMLGTTDAAAATMPGHGRAYILVGTGSRYEYFQSAYTGANKNMDIKPPTLMTYVTNTGAFDKEFYNSSNDNDIQKAKNKSLSAGVTQLEYVVEKIIKLVASDKFEVPEKIFQEPLRTELVDDKDEYNGWIGLVASDKFEVPEKIFQESLQTELVDDKDEYNGGNCDRLELCAIGQYDIPSKQCQSTFKVDLLNSNIAILGAALSGKTNLLKLIINCLHKKSDEKNEQIFILDFSGALQEYRDMPLVSAYFDNSNEEYVKRVFRILEMILKNNVKKLGSKNFVTGRNNELPHTTFIIDNLNAFIDESRYSAYHEKFGRLCRDGRSRGISIVFTATDTKGLARFLLSFEQKVVLNLPSEKCTEIFGAKLETLGNIAGRGYANVTERLDDIIGTFNLNMPYEVQILKCADITDTSSDFITKLREKYEYDEKTLDYVRKVKKYQTFPQELMINDYLNLKQPYSSRDKLLSDAFVEVGLDYVDFKPVGVDFKESRVIAIYGKREFGKTNLLKLLLDKLKGIKSSSRFVFFDDGRKQLREFHTELKDMINCEYIGEFTSVDVSLSDGRTIKRKLSPMQQFYKLLHEKYISLNKDFQDNPILNQIYGVDDENVMVDDIPDGCERGEAPPTVFVIQSKSIYLNTKTNSDFIHYILPELIDIAEDNDLIFIFTDVKKITDAEVNSELNSSLKIVFLLDNIAEFASERGGKSVFGEMDQKSLKEDYARCEIGDGYYYDVEADSLKKVKFIKVT